MPSSSRSLFSSDCLEKAVQANDAVAVVRGTAACWRMPDLACFVVLTLPAAAGVPLLPDPLAALAERVPPVFATSLRVDFEDGVFA